MKSRDLLNRKSEQGFTLVELAIVMIIIGLLIGGILKGQELIANAQVSSTVAQIKGIDAATSTFRDKYDALPGDMLNPTGRLPNCAAAPCNVPGNGNSRLDGSDPSAAPTGENKQFFVHMAAADVLGGVTIDGVAPAGGANWGGTYPKANIGGGYEAAYWSGGELGTNKQASAGHYLMMVLSPNTAPGKTNLTNLQALRIDRKMDDASPTGGAVFPNDGACTYTETDGSTACDLFVRFQN